MKLSKTPTKCPIEKFSTAASFYNRRNNEFARTNAYLEPAITVNTAPDDVSLEPSVHMKLILNNQEIAHNVNLKKFPTQDTDNLAQTTSQFPRNFSQPNISTLELPKVSFSNPKNSFAATNMSTSQTNTQRKPVLTLVSPGSRPVVSVISRAGTSIAGFRAVGVQPEEPKIKSARYTSSQGTLLVDTARTTTPAKPSFVPKGIQEMTPEELQELEKQVIAKSKFEQDRNSRMSLRVGTTKESKRDVSYRFQSSLNTARSPIKMHSLNIQDTGMQMKSLSDVIQESPRGPIPDIKDMQRLNSQTILENLAENYKKGMKKTVSERFTIPEDDEEPTWKRGLALKTKKTIHSKQLGIATEQVEPPLYNREGSLNTSVAWMVSSMQEVTKNNNGAMQNPLTLASQTSQSFYKTFQGSFNHLNSIGTTVNRLNTPKAMMNRKETFKVDDNDFLADLRKELPNALTSAPSSRQDVIVLGNWLETRVKSLFDSNTGLKQEEVFEKCDQVYSLCMNELIRQATIDCVERGELLQKVWTSYFRLFTQFKAHTEVEAQRQKVYYQEENQRQYERFQQHFYRKDQTIEDLKREIRAAGELELQNAKNNEKLVKRLEKFKVRNHALKEVINQLKDHMQSLKDENQQYAKRLAIKIASNTKGTYVPTFHTHGTMTPVSNTREASVPQYLGLGSSVVNSPRVTKDKVISLQTMVAERAIRKSIFNQRKKEDSLDEESYEEHSSLDFAYEDEQSKIKRVFKLDHLNNNVLAYKQKNILEGLEGGKMQVVEDVRVVVSECRSQETQTMVTLIGTKYNEVIENQRVLDDLLLEVKLKKEVDVLAEVREFSMMDLSKLPEGDNLEARALMRDLTILTHGSRVLGEDGMRGGSGMISESMYGYEKRNSYAIMMNRLPLAGDIRSAGNSVMGSDNNSPNGSFVTKTEDGNPYSNRPEDEEGQGGDIREMISISPRLRKN